MSPLAFVILLALAAPPSEAEQVLHLQQNLETQAQQLATVRQQLASVAEEYQHAETEFAALDDQLNKAAEGEQAALRREWKLARDRFDVAVQERRALQQKAEALERGIRSDHEELDGLLRSAKPHPNLIAHLLEEAAPPEKSSDAAEDRRKEDRQLAAAREQVRRAEEAAKDARERAETLTERVEAVRKGIEVELKLRDIARRKGDLARRTHRTLDRELQKAAENEKEALRTRIAAAEQSETEAAEEERAAANRLADLQANLGVLQAEQIEALGAAEQARRAADIAGKQANGLRNPFSPHNLLHWLVTHGPTILFILLGMLVLIWAVRVGSRRIVRAVLRRAHFGRAQSEDRAETLAGVFRSTCTAVIIISGLLMLLDQFGIPVAPLLGGAAVLGLAVAFGAQNLIKDYFTGFMVLLEDQYAVNDIVKINNVDGKVEKITLRMTVLRDAAGVAHFIPHGAITMVSNTSHGWSRVNVEVAIPYKEDPDKVMEVLKAICAELRADEHFGPLILEDADMLGVDALTDSGVIVKFLVKTRPTKQGEVKRELLRRIKKRFEQLGFDFPYPHRVIYHRGAERDLPPS
jgi:small conductance mechanosensitive channel